MNAVSTLSVHGHVTSPKMLLSVLLSDALTSKKNQCWLLADDTMSIPYIVNQFAETPDILVARLESAMDAYFQQYNPEIKTTVSHNADRVDYYTITVNIHAVFDNKVYYVTDDLLIKDSILSRTINAFNGVE